MSMRSVSFARINRRSSEGVLLDQLLHDRSFSSDIRQLAESRETRAALGDRVWIAGDFEMDPTENFLTGILGYEQAESYVHFDEESFSWQKGESDEVTGATRKTMVPFAIDMRDGSQYVCFTSTQTIRPPLFARALAAVLSEAAKSQEWEGINWDVDLISDRTNLTNWLRTHSDLIRVERTVKLPNPRAEYLEDDLKKMRLLKARQMKETYSVGQGGGGHSMSAESDESIDLITAGVDQGFTEVNVVARNASGLKETFSTKRRRATSQVMNYGGDLRLGASTVLDALRGFMADRNGEGQQTFKAE